MRRKLKKRNDYLSFEEARKISRHLGLKGQKEWENYSKYSRPPEIPSKPGFFYKNDGWVSWMDWLNTNNNPYWPSRKKYIVNDNFFKIWSPDMAYILGFWWADGWISEERNMVGITQHKKDKYILDQILKIMGSSSKSRSSKYNNCCSIEIYSKIMVSDIKKLGGMSRKSLVIGFPNMPKKYLPDFARGVWDGDGCITYTKFRECYVSNLVSGSKDFIYEFHNALKGEISGLNGSIHKKLKKNISYTLIFSRNDTIRLRDYMYGADSKLMLKRKFDKFCMAGKIKKVGRENRKYLSFCDSRCVVRNENLKTVDEWREYSRTKRPINIPSMPQQYYKESGWTNWYDFLGKEKSRK